MQLKLPFGIFRKQPTDEHWLIAGGRPVRLWLVPNRRARRYVLRLRADGGARVTIPRGGSVAEAKRFAQKYSKWLEKQLLRQAAQPVRPKVWVAGTEILFRGEPVKLTPGANGETGAICFGSEVVRVREEAGDWRPEVERHLRRLAEAELPGRVAEFAARHRLAVKRVTVRNQRSRWGSCSRRGTISLNWRLVQAPVFVRDYIVLHELAHLEEMNHSRRFWRKVAEFCPGFEEAERWLKEHSHLLR